MSFCWKHIFRNRKLHTYLENASWITLLQQHETQDNNYIVLKIKNCAIGFIRFYF
jgi:hypothetical protein